MVFGPPAIAFWAASREDSLASIRKVLDLKPSTILTSHGGPYRPEALARLVR
jgi:glyoxylase-like metal-dependent hydrolase (beta-lactamase superfamily II)